ncbi:MAG: hypothetical protein ACHREM_05455 [Polyangiales bacterium]
MPVTMSLPRRRLLGRSLSAIAGATFALAGCGTSAVASAVNDAGDEASIVAQDSAVTSDTPIDAATTPDAATDTAPDTSTGPVTKSDCSTSHLIGCYRGMYVSLQAAGTGDVTFSGATAKYANVLGDTTKENALLAFLTAHRIESLALYDLNTILADATLSARLLSFLERARAVGVLDVNAIGDTTLSAWDAIAAMQKAHAPFDGVVTEIEFWNPGTTFDQFTATLSYIRSLAMNDRAGAKLPLAAYVGWPTPAQIDATVPLLDRLYVHVYVTSADKAFGYGQARFQAIASANGRLGTHVDVWPIFSAEGTAWSAGAEHFMGDWLSTHTLDEAEATLLTDWEATPPGTAVTVSGFQYFSDFFMEQYVK